MVENARFFAQKRTFLHIFAGGRDDFLAGQKRPFFGFRESRERPRPRQNFASKIHPLAAPARLNRKIFFPSQKNKTCFYF
jgi:hypothetical protein